MRILLPSSVVLLLAAACAPSDADKAPNTAPGTPQVALDAASPATDADLVVVFLAQAADPEGDAVSYRFTWFQDGAVRSDLTTDTVPASATTRGQTWRVVVTPNDGALDGPVAEASATVVNTPPLAQVSLPETVVTTPSARLTCARGGVFTTVALASATGPSSAPSFGVTTTRQIWPFVVALAGTVSVVRSLRTAPSWNHVYP